MTKFILMYCCLLATTDMFSQHASEDANKVPKSGTETPPHRPSGVQIKGKSTPNASYINENDVYMGRQAEILEILKIARIPTDFPKYKKGTTIREYNEIMDDYYRRHPDIIKDIYRKKLGV